MVRRVAVIGAGSSGLVCMKVCLEEGLEPVCFEGSGDIGGLWNFKESPQPEQASIYRSLVTNTSKEMMCFSDFPMPDHYPNYMPHALLLQYYRLYAQHFDLLKHIHFQVEQVLSPFSSTCILIMERRRLTSDELPYQILLGQVVVKSNIKAVKESLVVFEDDSAEKVDVVLFCTGYTGSFSFLPQSLHQGLRGELTLYKRLFPPSLEQPSLTIMGYFHPNGPIMPLVEMQARWATRVFKGLRCLPPKDKMLRAIEVDRARSIKGYPNRLEAALQADYIPFLDFMANQIGVKPHLLGLLLKDPVLWARVFFDPCTPHQFRLSGPGQWPGARQAILSQWDRLDRPFKTRPVPKPDPKASERSPLWMFVFGGTVLTAALLFRNTSSNE